MELPLLRDVLPGARLSDRAWGCIGLLCVALGVTGLGFTLLVLVDAWQQFVGQGAVLDRLSNLVQPGIQFHNRAQFQETGALTLLIGGALVHAGLKEVRAAWKWSRHAGGQ
ncbi:MAG: hypothetical protein U0637_12405 [Phycisphaerales bacterium]